MAIIKVGPPLAGIRGTLGGIIFSENRTGTYARLWAMTSNPRSPQQMIERSYVSKMPSLWNALNDAQRDAWRAFADDPAQELTNPLGEDYFASGYNWFVKCNVRLLRVGRATIQAVPGQARPAAPTILEFRVTLAGTEVDQCTCGVATASTQNPAWPAPNAFIDNIGAPWQTINLTTIGWLQYVFCAPVIIRKYRLYSQALDHTRDPKDWTFEVANNGGWDVLQTITNYVFPDNAWCTFYPQNSASHDTYRINISANNGSAVDVRIWEMEMYLGIEDSSMIAYTEDDFDDAPDYDLVLHVSMGASIGMDVQYPGFYETLALQAPGRHHAECQTELDTRYGIIAPDRSWFSQLHRQTQEGLRSAAATQRTVTT